MRASRSAVTAAAAVLVLLLLSGCSVRIVDPAAGETRDDGQGQSAEPVPSDPVASDPATPRPADDPPASETPSSSGLSPENAADRDRLLAAATTTMPCPTGALDQDGAVIRVEGTCARLEIDSDAGVVIADDVDTLILRGSGTVVYAASLGSITVTGSADQVYWTGATPAVDDTGSGNTLRRG